MLNQNERLAARLVSAAVATDLDPSFVWPVWARMLAARLPGDVGAALLEATLAPSEFLSCQARSASASCGESAMRVAAATARAGWARPAAIKGLVPSQQRRRRFHKGVQPSGGPALSLN